MAMMRYSIGRRALVAGMAWLALSGAAWAQASPDALAIHKRILTLDSHVDILLPSTNPRYRTSDGESFTSLAKLRAGGVDALVYAVAVSTGPRTAAGYAAARAEADAKLAAIEALPQQS